MADNADFSYWVYNPTKGVSIVFAVLFAVSGALHIWENFFRNRSRRIGFILTWAALLFVAGFCLREYGAYHDNNLNIYISSQVLLFVAPPVYNGANYFIFGKSLYYIPYLAPIHPGRVWTTFITLDTVVGVLISNGAAISANQSNSPSKIKLGVDLVRASLLLQIGMFIAFVALIVIFHVRCIKANVLAQRTKVIIYLLYVSSVLILIRNAFRTATFFYPYVSKVNDTEALFWTIEVLPMFVNTYMLNIWPPVRYLPKSNKLYLAVDGKTECEGPGLVVHRPVIASFLDPFDIAGIITGKDNKNRFWECDGIGGPLKNEEGASQARPKLDA